MQIFGMGPLEVLVIAVIALVAFGPGKLPEIGAALGRAVSDFRRAARAYTADLEGSLDEARKEVEGTLGQAQAAVQEGVNTAQQAISAAEAGQLGPASAPAPAAAPVDDLTRAERNWLRLGVWSEDQGEATR